MQDQSSPKPLVVVAGATGYLGGYVVKQLAEAGVRVRALARSQSKAEKLEPYCEHVFIGEATRPETLEGLCDGADVVFSSLGIRAMRGRPTYWDVDYKANMNVVAAARAAGASHFVFVSVLRGDLFRKKVPQVEARERVIDDLKANGPEFTVIRPTGFFNDMSEFLQMAKKGKVWLIGKGNTPINPVHGADLAAVCVRAITDPAHRGVDANIGGPDLLTQQKIGELAFKVLDKAPRFGHVPVWVLRFLGTISRPFSPNFSSFMKFFSLAGSQDGVGDQVGTHRLEDFFVGLRDGTEENADALQIDRKST